MHIPDGFLSMTTVAATSLVSTGGVGWAIRETNRRLKDRQVPMMGVLAAFIFAVQMLNFPILIGPTSGHVLGAGLAAVLLGPWPAILIMTCVLIAQSLLFQDGGMLALGANVLNIAIIATLSAYICYRLCTRFLGKSRRGQLIGAFTGGWVSVVIAAAACALELSFSGVSPLRLLLPAMLGIHALIGVGEGLVTAAVIGLVLTTRADLIPLKESV